MKHDVLYQSELKQVYETFLCVPFYGRLYRVDVLDCTLAHFSRLLVLLVFDFLFFITTKMMIMTTMDTKRTAPIDMIPYMSAEITDLKIIRCTNTTEKREKSFL